MPFDFSSGDATSAEFLAPRITRLMQGRFLCPSPFASHFPVTLELKLFLDRFNRES